MFSAVERPDWMQELIDSNKNAAELVIPEVQDPNKNAAELVIPLKPENTFTSRPVTITVTAEVPKNSVVPEEEGSSDTLFEGTNSKNDIDQDKSRPVSFLQKYKDELVGLGFKAATNVLDNDSIKIDFKSIVKLAMNCNSNPNDSIHSIIETLNKYPETIKLMNIFGGYDLLMSKNIDDAYSGTKPTEELYMNLMDVLNEIVESDNFISILTDLGLIKAIKPMVIDESSISQAVEKYLKSKAANEINKVISSAIDKGTERWTEFQQIEMGKMTTELSHIVSNAISNGKKYTPDQIKAIAEELIRPTK